MGYVSEYNYKELESAALTFGASQEAINDLGRWFSIYGEEYWNGEYYDINGRDRLYPVYKEVAEDEYELTGYVID